MTPNDNQVALPELPEWNGEFMTESEFAEAAQAYALEAVRMNQPAVRVTEVMVGRAWMAFTGCDKLGPDYARDWTCMTREERRDMRAALEAALGQGRGS